MPKDLGFDYGYGAAFVRLYFKDTELSAQVSRFDYEYYEEGDDVCKLEIKLEDRNSPDKPEWQEKSQLKVLWGYIGGDSRTRKIYIQQIAWSFEKDGITAKIEATEKAVSMKYQDSQEVHKNISLLGLAHKFAKKHDLKALLEVNNFGSLEFLAPGDRVEPLSQYLIRNRNLITQRDKRVASGKFSLTIPITDELIKQTTKEDLTTLRDFLGGFSGSTHVKTQYDIDQEKGNRVPQRLSDFGTQQNAPQANKTDAQFLSEAAMKAPGGPWIVDTRDDELIIKKRNFRQPPYKSYNFGGDEGNIIEFTPVSKNRSRAAKAMNIGFQNWDPALKSVVTGNANAANGYSEEELSQYVQVYKFYKNAQDHKLGNLTIGDLVPKLLPSINRFNFNAGADNTANFSNTPLYRLQNVNTRVEALKGAIEDYTQNLYNNTFNPSAKNAVDAYNQANNLRKSNELKLNPATATMVGDPNLIVGILITIMGVSQKYSSNYYVIKATHSIVPGTGYMVNLEMATQGVNVKASKNHQKSKGSINKLIGPDQGTITTKKIPTKRNPK